MSIKIANDTANGNVTLKGQNVAGDKTITMPNLDCELAPRMQLMTAQNSTSGTAIDFTGIPSWAKKITVMFNGVSTSGTSLIIVQLGAGSIETTGYLGASIQTINGSTPAGAQLSSGFIVENGANASAIRHGVLTFNNIELNKWVGQGVVSRTDLASTNTLAGLKILSATLDRIRVTTVNGTDTFDAGQINILYEG